MRREIEAKGACIVLVHMGTDAEAAAFFERYGVADLPRVSDPQRELYAAFGLECGTIGQVIGPRALLRNIQAAFSGHFVGVPGDIRQMPGVFLIENGRVVREFRHRSSADRPDYVALVNA